MTAIWESWPRWLTDAAIAAYNAGIQPAEIGAVISRPEAKVRAKLVREGVYRSAAIRRKQRAAEAEEGF